MEQTVRSPVRIENRRDSTTIVTSIPWKRHVLRVVYRRDGDIIVIITLYPGRKKDYGL